MACTGALHGLEVIASEETWAPSTSVISFFVVWIGPQNPSSLGQPVNAASSEAAMGRLSQKDGDSESSWISISVP